VLTEVRAGTEAWERGLKWVRLESGKSLRLLSFLLNDGFVRNFRLRRMPTGAKGSGGTVGCRVPQSTSSTVALRIGEPRVRPHGRRGKMGFDE